jgi:hypothetical protein
MSIRPSQSLQADSTLRAAYLTRNWYHCVARAVSAFRAAGLRQRVYAAEEALFSRWMGMTDSVSDRQERQAAAMCRAQTVEHKNIRTRLAWPLVKYQLLRLQGDPQIQLGPRFSQPIISAERTTR